MAKTERITAEVIVKNIYTYKDYSFNYYGDFKSIITMESDDGTVYVWRTSSALTMYDEDGEYQVADKGDRIQIKASIKGHTEYKGQPQTELTRVKMTDIIKRGLTAEQMTEIKRQEQMNSIKGEDFIWKMPYRQYKEHYADCETLAGSYEETRYSKTIKVIIREGRLKKSGVRGKMFDVYEFENESGETVAYKAVCEENALKRCMKEHPSNKWECIGVY